MIPGKLYHLKSGQKTKILICLKLVVHSPYKPFTVSSQSVPGRTYTLCGCLSMAFLLLFPWKQRSFDKIKQGKVFIQPFSLHVNSTHPLLSPKNCQAKEKTIFCYLSTSFFLFNFHFMRKEKQTIQNGICLGFYSVFLISNILAVYC